MIRKLSLDIANLEAEKHGGKCLSVEYIKGNKPMKWRCAANHDFDMSLSSVRCVSWCLQCYHESLKLTINDAHVAAKKNGGKCLSLEYTKITDKLLWECDKHHIFPTTLYSVRIMGTWCPECRKSEAIKKRTLTLDDVQMEAEKRGGKCLSTEYIKTSELLLWLCANNHQFPMTLNAVKYSGSWCPHCANHNISEEICRAYFEHMLGYKFPKFRAKWLVNDAGNKTELDGFCPELRLAFEHHGEQHYKLTNFFHDTQEVFEKRQKDDDFKMRICAQNEINVIVIPQLHNLTNINFLPEIIKQECEKLCIPVMQNTDNIDLTHIYATNRLDKYIIIAAERGITYISGVYLTSKTKLKWMCSKGHSFNMSCSKIKAGIGCMDCAIENRRKPSPNHLSESPIILPP